VTIPQDAVLCAGIGMLLGRAGAGGARTPAPLPHLSPGARARAWAVFLAGWLPITTLLLLGWPRWSVWDIAVVRGSPGVSLPLGLLTEAAAFAAGLRLGARSAGRPAASRAGLAAVVGLYAASLLLPWRIWTWMPAEGPATGARRVWEDGPLLALLGAAGAWLLLWVAAGLRRVRPGAR
jgi:hypothetical protein